MDKNSISEKVLKTIKAKKIIPKPRWTFLLKDYSIWLISVLSLIIGSLAFSVIIFLVKNNDWDVYEHINDSLLKFTILSLPYFWIVFLVFFIIVAHYNFKHTKKGYKYQLHTIVISSIIISMLMGAFLYNFGAGNAIDRILAQRMPFYQRFTQDPRNRWLQSEKGLLAGEVIAIEEPNVFQLKDISGKIWYVISGEVSLNGGSEIKTGDLIRMVGQQLDEDSFQAKRVLPAEPFIRRRFGDQVKPWEHLKNDPMRGPLPVGPLPIDPELREKLENFKTMQPIEKNIGK